MKKIADFLVEKRILLFTIFAVLTVVCAILMNFVTINEDMTKYLPTDSSMSQGLKIMESQFPESTQSGTFKIMFENLSDDKKLDIKDDLTKFDGVSDVEYEIDSESYNSGKYTMYVVNTSYTDTDEISSLLDKVVDAYDNEYTVYSYYADSEDSVLTLIVPMALTILIVVLILMCKSYFEPVLIIAAIAMAILMNMGSNIIFASVSDMTYSIAAVLQLILSIDYSVIILHRYAQERALLGGKDNVQAMKNTLKNAFGSVSSSALTTIVGLLMLLFMSFTIGMDMGLVLAKGVLLSLIAVFTVLPTLILWCDKLIEKTNKSYLREKRLLKKEGEKNV